jgi:hypothetical protein
MPSTICAKLYNNIQAKYFEYGGLINGHKEKVKPKADLIEKETWNKETKESGLTKVIISIIMILSIWENQRNIILII